MAKTEKGRGNGVNDLVGFTASQEESFRSWNSTFLPKPEQESHFSECCF